MNTGTQTETKNQTEDMTEIENLKICLERAIKERDDAIWELEKAKYKIDGMNQYIKKWISADTVHELDRWKSRAEAYLEEKIYAQDEAKALSKELNELRHKFAKLLAEQEIK